MLWSDNFGGDNFTNEGWTISNSTYCTFSTTQKYTGDTYSARLAATNTGNYTYIQRAMSMASYTNLIVSYARYLSNGASTTFVCEWYDGSSWHSLETVTSSAASWNVETWSLPSTADVSGFELRFYLKGSSSNYAYLDNVEIIGL